MNATDHDDLERIRDRVLAAGRYGQGPGRKLEIRGGGTKAFYGREPTGKPLSVAEHRGIIAYEPTELVVSARAGTRLDEIESLLGRYGQHLPFEPPRFGPGSTLGGAVACGLSGPRRPHSGAARDLVLGVRILNGRGNDLRFGGQVMKNVAGYDVSRLMAGALGTLGVLLEISLKVMPRPEHECTLSWPMPLSEALERLLEWSRSPWPLSGTLHDGEQLFVRLSGAQPGVEAACRALGGDRLGDTESTALWSRVRDHRHPFLAEEGELWRLAVPEGTPPLPLPGRWVTTWGGTERWLRTEAATEIVREVVAASGGHATRFRGGPRSGNVFHPLSPGLARLHARLKQAFDPARVLNPGRMYPEF